MNNSKSQMQKRIKWLKILLVAGIFLVIANLIQLIFYSDENFRIFLNVLQFILVTSLTISFWFQLKNARKMLQEEMASIN